MHLGRGQTLSGLEEIRRRSWEATAFQDLVSPLRFLASPVHKHDCRRIASQHEQAARHASPIEPGDLERFVGLGGFYLSSAVRTVSPPCRSIFLWLCRAGDRKRLWVHHRK